MITWTTPEGWHCGYDPTSRTLSLTRSSAQFTVTLPEAAAPGRGVLDRIESFLDGAVQATVAAGWTRDHGRLVTGGIAVITSPAGGGQVINGSGKGHRRKWSNGSIQLAGRHYELRHPSRWRSELSRDRAVVATLRRRMFSRKAGRLESVAPHRVELQPAADEIDRAAVAIAGTVCGRPGRVGAVSNIVFGFL